MPAQSAISRFRRDLTLGAILNALLLVARYREELRHHEDKHEAMALALRTAGPAIVASGATVICALLCLTVAGEVPVEPEDAQHVDRDVEKPFVDFVRSPSRLVEHRNRSQDARAGHLARGVDAAQVAGDVPRPAHAERQGRVQQGVLGLPLALAVGEAVDGDVVDRQYQHVILRPQGEELRSEGRPGLRA